MVRYRGCTFSVGSTLYPRIIKLVCVYVANCEGSNLFGCDVLSVLSHTDVLQGGLERTGGYF